MTRRRRRNAATRRFLARLRSRAPRGSQRARGKRSDLIGRDLASIRRPAKRGSGLLPVLLIGALLAAMCLAFLRVDLIRQGYALAAAVREEKKLQEEHRLLTAQVRNLRHPVRLARLARRLGFERPERMIELDTPDVSAEPRP